MTATEKDDLSTIADENILDEAFSQENEHTKETASPESTRAAEQEEVSEESVAPQEEGLKEIKDKYLRLAADFQNYKRRTENERHEIAAYANEKIVKELLTVMDSFERALNSDNSSSEHFRSGVELIYKQLETILTNFGVEAIKTEKVPFDPNFHHAVLTEELEGVDAGEILLVMQKGYLLKGRVVRPAMVKVST